MTIKQLALAGAVALALVGCSSTSTTSEPAQAQPAGTDETPLSGTVEVSIEDFAFSPATLVVKKGSTLSITNNDKTGHSLTADDESFDTKVFGAGQTKTLTLDTTGEFPFHCLVHPNMTGTITVVE